MSANTSEPLRIREACFVAAFIAVLLDRLLQALLRYIPWVSANCNATWFSFANMGVAVLVAMATTYWAVSVRRRRRAPA